ncbi:thiamine-phosphate diphosphorylase [Erysipelatoclostridium sp. An173]|uniref:thiamine phosphate synthase n=1 Tax=Erysipelatoclostridium sp. An173 TaxID=1965571 RepID=UPI000B3839C8|nr:thiamine phosphate synthase [Erysipelatoclostridium sp. An173]OUP78640.1 thiamine-phosphate diphosphorylase [Erysipelatoclostridium sp. An173]
MNFTKEQLNLYLVTDRHWLANRNLEDDVEKAILGGVTMVQLREKNIDNDSFIELAKKVKQVCNKYKVPFIINDNLEVALAVDSDGIHIGQDDLPASLVRQKIGPDKILGVSAHNLDEAIAAKKAGATYLGAGAMFSTTTKDNTTNLSIEQLQAITKNVDIPVVAIGGINYDNCLSLKNCNLAGIAVVSAIMAATNISEAASNLKKRAQVIYD